MHTIKTLGLAAAAALSLGIGAAMAQEGPNATVSGSTWFGSHGPMIQAPAAGQIQSGSSDVDAQQVRPQWTPGVPYSNEAGEP